MLGYCDIMENLNTSLNYNQSGILRQRSGDVEVKKYCVTLLEKFGSLSYTRHTLEELDAELRAEVVELGGNPKLEDVLDKRLDWKRGTGEKQPEK
jgi:geranylgeranyl diphosphate synthase type 3